MDDEARAARDALPRHVLDIAFEHIAIRTSQIGGRLEIHAELAVRAEHGLVAADLLGPVPLTAIARKHEARIRKVFPDGVRRAADDLASRFPIDRPLAHRRAEQIFGRDNARQPGAGNIRVAAQCRVNAKVGPPVSGDQKASVDPSPHPRRLRVSDRSHEAWIRYVPSAPSAGNRNVHSALLQSLTLIVRLSTSLSWLSRTITSTAVPAGRSLMPIGVSDRRIALK